MNNNTHIPQNPDWDKLLDQLEAKTLQGEPLSPAEQQQLEELRALVAETAAALQLYQQIDIQANWKAIQDRINQTAPEKKPESKPMPLWPKIAAIAAAITIIFSVIYLNTTKQSNTSQSNYASDIKPGQQGATLTLANGKTIPLSSAKTGLLIGTELKYNDGTIDSSFNKGVLFPKGTQTMMLTASTSRGQTYQFTLPDGTQVWLNADSKISFPNQFNGKERKIMLSGEAYFAVVHNSKQPFRVESKGQVVEDTGTEFNINAYAEEADTKTTLVEGSAIVNDVTLKPNQQSITAINKSIQIKTVDVSTITDWKEGDFVFKRESLSNIMKKVARWYDIEVVYDKGVDQNETFSGLVSRNKHISEILSLMSSDELQFKIEGKKVTVTKSRK